MIEFAHAADAATQPNAIFQFLPWILIFCVMYFLMIRPQQKREKERQTMISNLKKGDRVLLSSGFYGKIIKAGEKIFTVELGKGMQVEIERNAIAMKAEEATAPTSSQSSENQTNS